MPGPVRRPRRPGEGGGGGGRKFAPRRKVCAFCADKIQNADYKDVNRLRRFLSDRGKIEPRRKTGTCAAHQRSLNVALKRARHLALLPFTAEHIRITGVVIREPGSGMRGPRPPRFTEGEQPAAGQPTGEQPTEAAATEEAAATPATVESAPAESTPAEQPEAAAEAAAAPAQA